MNFGIDQGVGQRRLEHSFGDGLIAGSPAFWPTGKSEYAALALPISDRSGAEALAERKLSRRLQVPPVLQIKLSAERSWAHTPQLQPPDAFAKRGFDRVGAPPSAERYSADQPAWEQHAAFGC